MNQGRYARSHKSRDQSWANKQRANNYTIQLDSSGKASKVAKTLVNAPKNQRSAQIKYQRNGQAYYKGVYGSYKTRHDANNAYQKLPAHLKNKAGIKQWHQLQREL